MAQRGGRSDWIGLRVARWRDIAGMTQQQLADAVGVSREYISMIENGRRAVTKRSLLYDLARALRVNVTDLTGQPVPPRSPAERAAHLVAPVVRQALDGFDDLPTPRSPEDLADLSDRAMSARMNADWAALGDILPGLLAETAVLADDGAERALGLHVRACVTSAQALKSFGVVDLARRVAERAAVFADRLGDPVHLAAAQFVTAQTVLACGSRRGALAVAERAAARLQPEATGDDGRALYGMLHLSAALSAATAGRPDDARAHLDEAASVAPTVSGDPWRMEFGPANVGVWRVAVALENGEAGEAPRYARQVDQTALRTVERRTRLHIDTARGLFLADRRDAAVRALLAADRVGPQLVRIMPVVREIVGQMLRDSPARGGSGQLRDLATRLGLDPLAPPEDDRT
ncbi:MAG TPA: helix-turn-helix transcriptional regulator [Mycobacteriales bacterium]|jgi:transcriptional regulator with XRE-family HTH domain|nr:helix-turn-helix transcriptional regulator [Mycobacteriales bacterium]